MKTKIISSLMLILCCAKSVIAQNEPPTTNAPSAAPGAAAVSEAPADALSAGGEVVPLISLHSEFPLIDAITNLAQQAGIDFQVAPELLTNGVPVPALREPVGMVQYEDVTYRTALDRLLAEKNLVLGTRPGAETLLLGTPESELTPIAPEGGDLAAMAPAENPELEAFFDPNKEVPLITAIQMLGRLAEMNLMIDPRLKTGGIRQVGTNLVELPAVATNTVSLSTYGSVSPKQTLEALLNNYGLVLINDQATGFSQVTFRDPTAKEPVYTYVIPLHYSNTTNIANLVQTTFPTARVQSDMRTAQLVVLSTEKEYQAITNLVVSLDLPTKQVLIEARFLETFTNPKSIKGIDWTDTLAAQRFTMGNGLLTGGTTETTASQTPGVPSTTTLPSGRPVTTTPASSTVSTRSETRNTTFDSTIVSLTSAGGFTPNMAFLNAEGVNAVLSFLNTQSDSRVLATPRAVTLDNQETRLEVTRAIPIFDASEAIGQAGNTVASSRPNYTNVGTILIVTPRITGTNVAMKVRPEISKVEPIPSRKVVQGRVNEADIFATSRIETHVMIPSGNTLVMGGLISDSTQNGYTKVPILGDIPVLGWAFRRESKERSNANLIIFVTPTIIEEMDFQPYRTDFLNTPMPEHDTEVLGPMDSGKPWDWQASSANSGR